MPAFQCRGTLGSVLTSSPLPGGYGGMIVNSDYNLEAHKALSAAYIAEAKRRDCILATITTSPIMGDNQATQEFFKADFTLKNHYQHLPLCEKYLETLPSKKRSNIRRRLRIARDAKLRTECMQNPSIFSEWFQIHSQRMNEIGASPLERKFAESLFNTLFPADLGFLQAVYHQDLLIGGILVVGLPPVFDVFMISFNSKFFSAQPASFAANAVIDECTKRGGKFLNWQSSSSEDSGVFQFKKDWGCTCGYHYYLSKKIGNIDSLISCAPEEIRSVYPSRFIIPFEELQNVSKHEEAII